MARIKNVNCKHCGFDFDLNSPEKKRVGGRINECPDCLEDMDFEDEPRYLGVSGGEGKVGCLSILAFDSKDDRESYKKHWRNNSGHNKGASCQLGKHNSSMSGMKFRTVSVNRGNANHKGKS